MRTRIACLGTAVSLFLLANLAWADGVVLNGASPRSIGRGGTNLAHCDNGALLFDNPAGAVNIEGRTLVDVGANLVINDFFYSDPRNRSSADDSVMPLPAVSFIRRSADGRAAAGLGVYVPAGFGEVYDLEGPPALPGRHRYKSFGSLAKILPGAAWRANDRLSIGATLGVAVSHDELEGAYVLQGPGGLRGTPTLFDLQATGAALCWSVGLQYDLTDATTLGMTYQSESRFRADGSTRAFVPGLGESHFDSQLDITWPRSLGLGMRHEICPHRVLSMDVIWYNWSAAFDDLGIHLNNPSNPLFPAIYEQFPLRWRDTASMRLGYEHALGGGRVVRCGYVYHHNPVPKATLTPYIQSIQEHAVAAGYGWTWRGWEIDVAYMFAFGPELAVDSSGLVGGNFDHSLHRAQTHDISFSFLRRF